MSEQQPKIDDFAGQQHKSWWLKRICHLAAIFVCSLGLAAGCANPSEPVAANVPENATAPHGELVISHFDVGQADATLIQAPNGTVLIDAGDWQRNDVVPHLTEAGVDHINLIILTHPHADHIGQVPQVLETFDVTEVWMSGWEHDTRTFERVLDAVLESDVGYHEPRAGETVDLGELRIEVIHPIEPLQDVHDNLAVRIVFGDFAAVYTGDAETNHEAEMIQRGHDLRAQVLQLGHHGSRTSSSREFLEAVGPEVAIYSAQAGHDYGHPHAEVVERISDLGITLYGTDVHGTIVVRTDGTTFEVTTERDSGAEPVADHPSDADCVDLNTASVAELQEIMHIGEERAMEIVELRPFESVDQLDQVSGIGRGRLQEIKEEGLACVK